MNFALVGRLGSGKTTVAKILVGHGYTRHSWADGVRDIFSMAFESITPENYATIKATKYLCYVNGTAVYRTGRDLLQRIGTDALRNQVSEDFWLRAGLQRLGGDPLTWFVNDDTRFLNEAAALRERGFTIVRIERPREAWDALADQHPSETEQASIEVDYSLTNDGTIEDLRRKVERIMVPNHISRGGVSPAAPATLDPQKVQDMAFELALRHEIVSEEWGNGDGGIFTLLGDRYAVAGVDYRGEWPPDTRVAGRLTCCGQTEHPIDCPQWR